MPNNTPPSSTKGVALTLSGGGFRATLFHLGVVRFLHHTGILPKVTHITSVSGGSILAAHLVLNWERYTGTEQEFDGAARELVKFTQWDLRGRVVRPWLFSWAALTVPRLFMRGQWWRTALLQAGYDRLYRDPTGTRPATLKDLTRPGRPELHILAASMTTGQLASFGLGRFSIDTDPSTASSGKQAESIPADAVPVSLAVAASSAFPPLFPPVRVDHETFGAPSDRFDRTHYLADGGVFDNLGIRKMLWIGHPQGVNFERVVVSDAQRVFTKDYESEYNFLASRAGRSVDLLMDRVSWFENDSLNGLRKEHLDLKVLECRLQNEVPTEKPYALAAKAQFAVQNVRTDLDAFSDVEVNAVVHQGTAVARHAWEGERSAADDGLLAAAPVWHPITGGEPSALDIHKAARRKLGLFRISHWATWATGAVLLLYATAVLVVIVIPIVVQTRRFDRMEDEERLKRDAEHVQTKLRLIRTLGRLASASAEEWEDAKSDWYRLVEEIKSRTESPWFLDFLTGPDPEDNSETYEKRINCEIAKGSDGHDLFTVTLQMSEELRTIIGGDETSEGRYLNTFRPQREETYKEAVKLAERLADPDPKFKELSALKSTRGRFMALYWGDMVLVEGKKVKEAMIDIHKLLKAWEAAGDKAKAPPGLKDKLKAAAKNLKEACDAELNPK